MLLKVDLRNEKNEEKSIVFQLSDFATINGDAGFIKRVIIPFINDDNEPDNIEFRHFSIIDVLPVLYEDLNDDTKILDYFTYQMFRVLKENGEPINGKAYLSLEDAYNKMASNEFVEFITGYSEGSINMQTAKEILEETNNEND